MSLLRRIAICLAVVVGIATFSATPAWAGTARIEFMCASMGPMIRPVTFDFTITPPATAGRGQTATIPAIVEFTTYPVQQPEPAGKYQATLTVALQGAGTETLRIPMTNPALQVGDYQRFEGSAPLSFPTAGTVTYRPRHFALPYAGCIPRYPDSVPVVATTQVS